MGVVSHRYGQMVGGREVCGTKSGGVGHLSGDAEAIPECEVKTLMTPDHTAYHVGSYG